MRYSIGQVAKKMGLTAHTLRYYDKEGLLPFVQKSGSGIRMFEEQDIEWLIIIECLKATGMPLKNIRQYITWCLEGDSTINQRLEMFKNQKQRVLTQIQELQQCMQKIDLKIAFYEDAAKHGNVNVYERNKCLAQEKQRLFESL